MENYWVFPFLGIKISDAASDGEAPDAMFLANRAGWFDRNATNLISEGSASFFSDTVGTAFEGFLAIRWQVPERDGIADVARVTLQRAKEIASLFTLAVIGLKSTLETCGLLMLFSEQVNEDHQCVAVSAAANVHYADVRPKLRFRNAQPAFEMTRHELNDRLEEHGLLHDLILADPPSVQADLRQAIRAAAAHVAGAFIGPTAESQLVRSINAMEALFGQDFSSIQRRIESVIGEDAFSAYQVEDIFRVRHAHVHAGAEVSFQLAVNAIFMSTDVLKRMGLLLDRLKGGTVLGQVRFMEYLDFEQQHRKLSSQAEFQEFVNSKLRPVWDVQRFNPQLSFPDTVIESGGPQAE